jgi:hypothetical protein
MLIIAGLLVGLWLMVRCKWQGLLTFRSKFLEVRNWLLFLLNSSIYNRDEWLVGSDGFNSCGNACPHVIREINGCGATRGLLSDPNAQQRTANFNANLKPSFGGRKELVVLGLDLPSRLVNAKSVIARAFTELCEQQLGVCFSSSDIKVVYWQPRRGSSRFLARLIVPSPVAALIIGKKHKLRAGLTIDKYRRQKEVGQRWKLRRVGLERSRSSLPVVTPPPRPPPPSPPPSSRQKKKRDKPAGSTRPAAPVQAMKGCSSVQRGRD